MTKHLEYILTVIFAKYKIAPSQVMATLNKTKTYLAQTMCCIVWAYPNSLLAAVALLALVGLHWPVWAFVGLRWSSIVH